MFTLFFRAAFLYAVMILTMRLLGKRQLGEFEPYELALTILLADIISSPIGSVSTPLLYGILPVAAVIAVHGIISIACVKSDKIRSVISGRPTLIVNRGVIDLKALDKLCLSLSDLLEGLRGAGFLDPNEVGTAIVEANGKISAFPADGKRPPNKEEMNMPSSYEGLPMVLVVNGRIQKDNLNSVGKNEKWLGKILASKGAKIENTALCMVDTAGDQQHGLNHGQDTQNSDLLEDGDDVGELNELGVDAADDGYQDDDNDDQKYALVTQEGGGALGCRGLGGCDGFLRTAGENHGDRGNYQCQSDDQQRNPGRGEGVAEIAICFFGCGDFNGFSLDLFDFGFVFYLGELFIAAVDGGGLLRGDYAGGRFNFCAGSVIFDRVVGFKTLVYSDFIYIIFDGGPACAVNGFADRCKYEYYNAEQQKQRTQCFKILFHECSILSFPLISQRPALL